VIPFFNDYTRLNVIMAFIIVLVSSSLFNLVYASPKLQAKSTPTPILTNTSITAELLVDGLEFPTNMAFINSGDVLVTEKNEGTVKRIINWTVLPEPLLKGNVSTLVESGMLGISVLKQEDENSGNDTYVYLYLTESVEKDEETRSLNRLYRYELEGNKFMNPRLIFEMPGSLYSIHNGGDIAIGPDRNVYVVVGDLNKPKEMITSNFENGTIDGSGGILRFTPDGEPVGNGVFATNGVLSLYYAYGIRNSFGISFDPLTGHLWGTENGGGLYDEINLIKPGFNGGYAKIEGPISFSDQNRNNSNKLEDFDGKGKYSDPKLTWIPTVAPTGIQFFDSDALGNDYKNNLFVGDFKNGNIYNFKLNENRTGLLLVGPLKDLIADSPKEYEPILFGKGFGNITDIAVGPDGYLYILTVFLDDDLNDWTKCNTPGFNRSCHGAIYRIR
jgi:glucose/arabinose dehydrogenase